MSKELDELSDTCEEYVKLFNANPQKRSFTRRVTDSFLFCMLFFPLLALIDDLKSLKDEKRVYVVDAIEAWIKFLLLGGAYTAVAVAICALLYRLSLLSTETQITLVSIILVLVLIIAVPSWLITRWANKK